MKRRLPKWKLALLIIMPIAALLFSLRELLFPLTEIKPVDMPEMQFVYVTHLGSYRNVPEWFQHFDVFALESGVKCKEYVGQYLDVPGTVKEADTRSHIGCTVDGFPYIFPDGLQTETFPAHLYLSVRQRASGELAAVRQNNALTAYCLKHRYRQVGPLTELYNLQTDLIGQGTMLVPVEKLSDD